MICPLDLKKRYHEGRVLPFLGAGVSMSVCWNVDGKELRGASWEELVEQATKMLGFSEPSLARVRGTDLQILEYYRIKNAGQSAPLMNWLLRKMSPPDDAVERSDIHKALVALNNCKIFYTTNYDDFLERAFQLSGRAHRVVAVEAHMGSNSGSETEIVKFHGDLNNPEQIVLTESQYEKRLRFDSALDTKLRSDLQGRVLLFIGYSFRDPNVSYLFRLSKTLLENQAGAFPGVRAYITVPEPSEFENELFKERGIEVIPIRASRITQDIAELIGELRA